MNFGIRIVTEDWLTKSELAAHMLPTKDSGEVWLHIGTTSSAFVYHHRTAC